MKNFLAVGLLVSSAFFAPSQANEINGNNDCNQIARSDGCLPGGGAQRTHRQPPVVVQQPPVIVQPQPNPPAVVQNPPQYNNGYGRGYGDGYRGNLNRNNGGIYFNFQTDPYYDTYNYPNYYDDPYYNDEPSYYADPYPPRYQSYPRTRLNKCTAIAKSLRNSGYRSVRSQDCVGSSYVYTALRNGDRLRLTVSSSSGRILKIRRVG
jgi:hypothetical protein